LLTLLFLSLPFVTHPSPPNIYPLSLHDALPICSLGSCRRLLLEFGGESSLSRGFFQRLANHAVNGTRDDPGQVTLEAVRARSKPDRKSTRLNSSHVKISYAVFCLKKKNNNN